MMKEAGFADSELAAETGFNSSSKTRGVLFRAVKPGLAKIKGTREPVMTDDPMKTYQTFFDQAYAAGALDRKTKHLIALAASLAAGCEP